MEKQIKIDENGEVIFTDIKYQRICPVCKKEEVAHLAWGGGRRTVVIWCKCNSCNYHYAVETEIEEDN
jgi:rubredoxin